MVIWMDLAAEACGPAPSQAAPSAMVTARTAEYSLERRNDGETGNIRTPLWYMAGKRLPADDAARNETGGSLPTLPFPISSRWRPSHEKKNLGSVGGNRHHAADRSQRALADLSVGTDDLPGAGGQLDGCSGRARVVDHDNPAPAVSHGMGVELKGDARVGTGEEGQVLPNRLGCGHAEGGMVGTQVDETGVVVEDRRVGRLE